MIKIKIITKTENYKLKISDNNSSRKLVLGGNVIKVGDYKHYDGDYEIVPKIESQEMETKNKLMDKNITVEGIPFFETATSNTNGRTISIG